MTKRAALFLLVSSVLLILLDFYLEGFGFDKGRIFRNLSCVCLIAVAVFSLNKLKQKK
jgi:hypothetical protein